MNQNKFGLFPLFSSFLVPFCVLGLFVCATGCAPTSSGYCVEGAQEFVLDSYKIQQGALAILELQGECFEPLTPCDFTEYEDEIQEGDALWLEVILPHRKEVADIIHVMSEQAGFGVYEGSIFVPSLGSVPVEGKTLRQAQEILEHMFCAHLCDAKVMLRYRDRMSRKVELSGLVGVTSLPVDGKLRLYDVLCQARVSPMAGLFKSYVLRSGRKIPIDFSQLLHEGAMEYNIVMQGGDKVYIADPQEAKVFVMGEVGLPKPLPLPLGTMSLREALVSAGGIPYTGDRYAIEVIRGGVPFPRVFSLSWEEILHLPEQSLLLIPGDTVYVHETTMTQWNRFISQLLPSLGGAHTAAEVLKGVPF